MRVLEIPAETKETKEEGVAAAAVPSPCPPHDGSTSQTALVSDSQVGAGPQGAGT